MRRFVALLLAPIALLALPGTASADHWNEGNVRFKVTCQYDHSAPDDPIVFPNQPGAAHLHDFFGRRDLTAFDDTYQELVQGTTTCNDNQDRAGYWTPAVYIDGGQQLVPVRMTAYYRRGQKDGTIQPYPDGLKLIAGYSLSDPSAPVGKTGWQCNGVAQPRPTPTGCTTDLTIRVNFPDCWDGVNTDSADHRSHMAYSIDGGAHNVCPASHPVPVPSLTTYTHFNLPAGSVVTSLSSSPNLQTGVHGDFFNGWTTARLQFLVDTCLNGFQRCDSGGP